MPAASNIVLADAQATPVNHTFIPMGKDTSGVMWYEDQSQSNPLGYWKISLDIKKPFSMAAGAKSDSTRVIRVKWALHEPTLETLGTADNGLTPPPTIAYVTRSQGEFIIPERSSLQNRKDVRKMAASLLGDSQFVAAVESLQAIY